MRELVLMMSMSLDGFVSGLDGDIGWIFNGDQAGKAWKVQAVSDAGLHIMGSRTFRAMAAHWPDSTDAFAAPMNGVPKAVFSSQGRAILPAGRPGGESWTQAYVAGGALAAEVAQLKAQDGKEILAHGGASFASSLISEGLVDRYVLTIYPVALGQGRPIFTRPTKLHLISAKTFPQGAVTKVFRPE